ncbi:MAG: hypothetical protein FI729_06610 [SAR202 cluster bacterium]|nr:hypothetical protein [SAR202 cluster bacterium]|tara:strand:- start:57685 stop:57942 length:258 start_codon:yes stop_codon:yes gene_type:complete
MSRAITYRLLIYGLLTLLSITAFFRLIILGVVIAGFTGIIIAVIKLSHSNSNNAKRKESTNKKYSNVIEARYQLIDEEDSGKKSQ